MPCLCLVKYEGTVPPARCCSVCMFANRCIYLQIEGWLRVLIWIHIERCMTEHVK